MKKLLAVSLCVLLVGCSVFNRTPVINVNGGQGVYVNGSKMYINGSAQISVYVNKKKIQQNNHVFDGYTGLVNHMGAISGGDGDLYAGVEYFDGSYSKNIQVGIYDAKSLKLLKCFPIDKHSGQKECAGVAYNHDDHTLWLTEWGKDASSRYFYHYNLQGKYLGRVKMIQPVFWIQGIAFYNHKLYVAADDGDAQKNQPDHIYSTSLRFKTCTLKKVRTLSDVKDQGEVEGLSVTKSSIYVLYNRGAKVVNGQVMGLEKGYKKQLHEVYIYDRTKN